MDWIPELGLGWLNGWLPASLYAVALVATILSLPRDVVHRLFDTSTWTAGQNRSRRYGGIVAVALVSLISLSPLKVGQPVFYLGAALYVLGVIGVVLAILNFRDAPLDQPAANGLYRFSRNPQSVGLGLVGLGTCIAVGSWLALLLLVVVARIYHKRVWAEEQACLAQYGDSYRQYMERVPRYFLFF